MFNGSGTETDPYLIYTRSELEAVAYNLAAHYKLMADIDLQNIPFTSLSHYDVDDGFTGTFDGNSRTIRNIVLRSKAVDRTDYIALFGYVSDGSLKNIYLENVLIEEEELDYCGALVGEMYNASIENCHATNVTIRATGPYLYGCGGLIGSSYGDSIKSCSVNGVLIESTDTEDSIGFCEECGGLVGSSYFVTNIERCFVKGTIKKAYGYCGGLIGVLSPFGDCYVKNCFTIIVIESNSVNSGYKNVFCGIGLCGNTVIQNCYSICEFIINATIETQIAGISLKQYVYQNDPVITSCYYDTEIKTSPYWVNDNATAKTKELLKKQNTYDNWDFENVWAIIEDETYPFFTTKRRVQCNSIALNQLAIN